MLKQPGFATVFVLCLFVLFNSSPAHAQNNEPQQPNKDAAATTPTTDKAADKAVPPTPPIVQKIPDKFNSPQQTLITFVEAMNKMEKDKDRAEKDAFACFLFDDITKERASETAA